MIALSPMPRGSGGWTGTRCVRADAGGKTLHGDRGITGGGGEVHMQMVGVGVCVMSTGQPSTAGEKIARQGCKAQG